LSFEAQGRRWRYPKAIARPIAALSSDTERTANDLETMLGDKTAIPKLNKFLALLALAGVILVDNGRQQ
jgi:hypothetical protein